MARIRLNTEEIKHMNLFESMTGATIKDCITDEEGTMGFLIKKGEMGLAIGKGGINIERFKKAVNKEVWVMEFSEDPEEFIRNLFTPTKIRSVRIDNIGNKKTATIEVSKKDTRKIIGLNGNKIKTAKKLAERHLGVEDIKIKSIY